MPKICEETVIEELKAVILLMNALKRVSNFYLKNLNGTKKMKRQQRKQ